MIRFWVIRSLMRCVNSFRGQNPHCRCLCTHGRQVRPFCWTLQQFGLRWLRGPPHCRRRGPRPLPPYCVGGGQVIRDRTARLSVQILGVRRTTVYRWKPSIWLAASSSSVSGASGSSGVGPTSRLFTNILGGAAGQRTSDGSGHQPTTGRRCYVVKSADTVTVCYGDEQDVILHDGLRPQTVFVSESRGR